VCGDDHRCDHVQPRVKILGASPEAFDQIAHGTESSLYPYRSRRQTADQRCYHRCYIQAEASFGVSNPSRMKSLFPVFSALGFLGFAASLVTHIYGLLERPSPFGSWAWALHVAIFPLFVPLVYWASKTKPESAGRDNVTHLMNELPSPVRHLTTITFIYALLNFALFVFQASHYPKKEVPEWLTQRGFSGHWMLFYVAIGCGFWGLHLHGRKNGNKEA